MLADVYPELCNVTHHTASQCNGFDHIVVSMYKTALPAEHISEFSQINVAFWCKRHIKEIGLSLTYSFFGRVRKRSFKPSTLSIKID